jgi:hypothetical protein
MFEKMLSNRPQFEAAEHGVLHPNQFGGFRQNSTEDAGCFLTHIVHAGWHAKLKTSMVAFDLAQFFPSLLDFLLPRAQPPGQVVDTIPNALQALKPTRFHITCATPWSYHG